MGYTFYRFQVIYVVREYGQCIHISVQLIVEAALQPTTLAGKLGLVYRKILVACSRGIYRFEISKPCAAAKFTAAGAYAAYLATFLPCTYLLHLHLHLEVGGVYPDQLTEIDTLISSVEESSLFAIGLYLHFAELHFQVQAARYSAGADEYLRLTLFLFLALYQLFFGSRVQYAPGHFELFNAVFFHLQLHQFTGEAHLPNIIATYTFYRQPVTLFQDGVHIVAVKIFTASFAERHFYDRVRFSAVMQRKCIEPVKNI